MKQFSLDAYLRGDEGQADFLFPLESWIECQRDLATVDGIMRLAATQCRLLFLTDLKVRGGGWPARRVRRLRALAFSEVQIVLNPNFLQNEKRFYQLNRHTARSLFHREKTTAFQTVKVYSVVDLANRELLVRDLNDALASF
ncbi:MAG: hypothetical protein AB1898_20180 [Acidobacteriota bacterium]